MNKDELASACDRIIRECTRTIERASLRIGWYGLILKENDLFRDLGFEDECAYFRSCGIGRSTWFRALDIAIALKDAGKDKVLSMKIENARMLAKCPKSDRSDPELIDAAISDSCRDFERRIRERLPNVNTGIAKIRRIALIVEMGNRERKEINCVIDEWMGRHNVSDRAVALLEIVQFAATMMKSKRAA